MSRPAPLPGRAPRSAPPVATAAVALAVLVLALGAVVIADAAGAFGSSSSSGAERAGEGARRLLESLDGLSAGIGTTAVGVALALAGLALLVEVVRPAPRTHVPVGPGSPAAVDLWLTPRAVATLAAEQAEQHIGVLDARAESASRKKIVVAVVPRDVEPDAGLAESVRTEVVAGLSAAGLAESAPTVQVRVRTEEQR